MEQGANRKTIRRDAALALLAAALYAVSIPFSKALLAEVAAFSMAAFLYLGAGTGMLVLRGAGRLLGQPRREAALAWTDLPWAALVVVLDIAAPVCLMLGLQHATASSAALLSNFEIVTTSLIALAVFREAIGRRQALAIALVTLASVLLSADLTQLSFAPGSLLVLLACVFWGLENNCTRRLSVKDPAQIVVLKGLGSGGGALLLALLVGEKMPPLPTVGAALALGFLCYGLSIFCYVKAQRGLGAARTSTFYAAAPFLGAALSLVLLRESVGWQLGVATALLAAGFALMATERHHHAHTHAALAHEHRHGHDDAHHGHTHDGAVSGEHSHPHIHEPTTHEHEHLPDVHHEHGHEHTRQE